MAASEESPQEVLRQEILADAGREAGKTLLRARQEAEALVAKAEADAALERNRVLDKARAAAERRAALLLAKVPVETGRMRSEHIEALLRGVHDEALIRLTSRDKPDARGLLLALAAEAARGMEGNAFVMRLSPEDRRALGGEWLPEIRRLAAKPALEISLGEDLGNGDTGPVLLDAGGRQVWDNRVVSRLARMWPALRTAIAARTGLLEPAAQKENGP